MRLLIVHNRYQHAGGEDTVFQNEVQLLRDGGHDVETLESTNVEVTGTVAKAVAAGRATYSRKGRDAVAAKVDAMRPDLVHVHNFFPYPSPALFDATVARAVPTVWTLHNYRVTCANGLLFRDGVPCEKCIGGSALWGVVHRCYRGSLPGSAAVAAMIGTHRLLGTYRHKVTRFIVLSAFARDIAVRAGLPPAHVAIKPNFARDPGGAASAGDRGNFVFVGRLSVEKGVRTLIEAWQNLSMPLVVVGDGPERAGLEAMAPPTVRFVGALPRDQVAAAMANARALIVPSVWYENYPMTVPEAMALGTPVIASSIGALKSLVAHGIDGWLFTVGDPASLAEAVEHAARLPEPRYAAMREAARARYEAQNLPSANLARLVEIYAEAIEDVREPRRRVAPSSGVPAVHRFEAGGGTQ